jgi:transcriptional regulator with XRE-family HTH domain
VTPPDDHTLRILRDVSGLTQAQIGERYGVSQSTVAGWYAAMRARSGEPNAREVRRAGAKHTKAELERYQAELIESMRTLLLDTSLVQSAGEQTARARAMAACLDVLERMTSGATTEQPATRSDLLERVKRATASARSLRVVGS